MEKWICTGAKNAWRKVRGAKMALPSQNSFCFYHLMDPSEKNRIPPALLWAYFAISVFWLIAHATVILRFRMLDSDSIMYGLPLAFSKNPFDLAIPWIGDLRSYDNVWGHHWVGGMWLRAAIYSIVPFSRALDICLLLLAVWGAATLTARLIWRITGWWWLSAAGALLILSDRLVLANIQLHRFESLALLALVVYLTFVMESRKGLGWGWTFLGCLGAFFLPTMHPFGLPLGAALSGFFLVKAWMVKSTTASQALAGCGASLAGVAAIFFWFYLQPGAMEQFTTNVALQNSFSKGNHLVLWNGLSGYRLFSGYLLWSSAALACGLILAGFAKPISSPICGVTLRWLPALLFCSHAAFYTVTKTLNYAYICLSFPVAAILISMVAKTCFLRYGRVPAWAVSCFFVGVTAIFGLILPHRVVQFAKAGFPDFPQVLEKLLADMPKDRTIFIPPPVWAEAIQRPDLQFQQWTFSVASSKALRRECETQAYSKMQRGDILICDDLAGRNGDPWGILPTFDYKNLDPTFWKKIQSIKKLYPGTDADFGYDFSIYEFQGGDWVSTLPALE